MPRLTTLVSCVMYHVFPTASIEKKTLCRRSIREMGGRRNTIRGKDVDRGGGNVYQRFDDLQTVCYMGRKFDIWRTIL